MLLLLDWDCLNGIEILAVILDVEGATSPFADICIQYPLRWLVVLVVFNRAVHSYRVKQQLRIHVQLILQTLPVLEECMLDFECFLYIEFHC
jgi:hypothetical protein